MSDSRPPRPLLLDQAGIVALGRLADSREPEERPATPVPTGVRGRTGRVRRMGLPLLFVALGLITFTALGVGLVDAFRDGRGLSGATALRVGVMDLLSVSLAGQLLTVAGLIPAVRRWRRTRSRRRETHPPRWLLMDQGSVDSLAANAPADLGRATGVAAARGWRAIRSGGLAALVPISLVLLLVTFVGLAASLALSLGRGEPFSGGSAVLLAFMGLVGFSALRLARTARSMLRGEGGPRRLLWRRPLIFLLRLLERGTDVAAEVGQASAGVGGVPARLAAAGVATATVASLGFGPVLTGPSLDPVVTVVTAAPSPAVATLPIAPQTRFTISCNIGLFAGPDDIPLAHDWVLIARGSGEYPVRLILDAVDVSGNGGDPLRLTWTDATGLPRTTAVPFGTRALVDGLVRGGEEYPIRIEPSDAQDRQRHYRLGFEEADAELAWAGPHFYVEEGANEWGLRIAAGEDLEILLLVNPPAGPGVPPQATEVEYSLLRLVGGRREIVRPAVQEPLTPDRPVTILHPNDRSISLVLRTSASGHYRLEKIGGDDARLYLMACEIPPPAP